MLLANESRQPKQDGQAWSGDHKNQACCRSKQGHKAKKLLIAKSNETPSSFPTFFAGRFLEFSSSLLFWLPSTLVQDNTPSGSACDGGVVETDGPGQQMKWDCVAFVMRGRSPVIPSSWEDNQQTMTEHIPHPYAFWYGSVFMCVQLTWTCSHEERVSELWGASQVQSERLSTVKPHGHVFTELKSGKAALLK